MNQEYVKMRLLDESAEVAEKWASMVQTKLRLNASAMGNSFVITRSNYKKLSESISFKIGKINAIISNVSFSFALHGVFVQKGVGRGYAIEEGMVMRTSKDTSEIKRHPNPWLNPVIEQALPGLADKLAEKNADAVLNATRIMIR